MASQTRLVLADDHPIFLEGLRRLLEMEDDFDVVGEATTGTSALRLVGEAKPDVAILDVSLPELSGIALSRRLAADCPGVRVLMLTLHEDRSYLNQALQAGARGYVLKRSASGMLVHAIRAVMVGGTYVDPAIVGRIFDSQPSRTRKSSADPTTPDLTARELDVLKLIAAGLTNKEIARRLDIGVKTIDTYRSRAVDKLGLKTRSDIVRYAMAQGWLADI
jgi:DNA-binding NarL/FixJ family response regulator